MKKHTVSFVSFADVNASIGDYGEYTADERLDEGLDDISYGDANYTLVDKETVMRLMEKYYGIPQKLTDLHIPTSYVNREAMF